MGFDDWKWLLTTGGVAIVSLFFMFRRKQSTARSFDSGLEFNAEQTKKIIAQKDMVIDQLRGDLRKAELDKIDLYEKRYQDGRTIAHYETELRLRTERAAVGMARHLGQLGGLDGVTVKEVVADTGFEVPEDMK